MQPKYFGTDGIRGKGFSELTANLAFHLGNSLKEAFNNKIVIIGEDTRLSSPMLAKMVASGALLSGLDVYYAGVVSTPMIAYYAKLKNATGIMITASHNYYLDNGIKIFNKGYKSKIEEELIVEKYIEDKKVSKGEVFGKFNINNDIEDKYFNLIDQLQLKQSNLKVVYDSANGANHLIASKIFSKYYSNSKQINFKPNGKNINEDCGSTNLEKIIKYLQTNQMELGFAYDGDGDRVIMIDKNSKVYDGDLIILLLAKYLKQNNILKNNGVVITEMTNPGIKKALNENGINYFVTSVGDKHVYQEMLKRDLVLGGEASGHIIIKNLLHSGDGLLTSLYILKIINEDKEILKSLEDVYLYPFKMVNIKNVDKRILNKDIIVKKLAEYKKEFIDTDIFSIRASGTEDVIRVTISCSEEDKLDTYLQKVIKLISSQGGNIWKGMD